MQEKPTVLTGLIASWFFLFLFFLYLGI